MNNYKNIEERYLDGLGIYIYIYIYISVGR